MTDALKRFSAPLSQTVWGVIDDTAGRIARPSFGAHRGGFNGPCWDADVGSGPHRTQEKGAGKPAWGLCQASLVEVRMPFALSLAELENVERAPATLTWAL